MPKIFTEDQYQVIYHEGQEYLTSPEKIEVGDHYLMKFGNQDYSVMEGNSVDDVDRANNHPIVSKACTLIVATSDFTLELPTIKQYWLEQAHNRFEAANYHTEFHMVEEAVEYMSEEKAIEYLKQVQTP